jgi:hypothetical protein
MSRLDKTPGEERNVIADICDVANPHVFLSAGTN